MSEQSQRIAVTVAMVAMIRVLLPAAYWWLLGVIARRQKR